jgi:hypothetical protein
MLPAARPVHQGRVTTSRATTGCRYRDSGRPRNPRGEGSIPFSDSGTACEICLVKAAILASTERQKRARLDR